MKKSNQRPDNPYLLLTPGPLSTTKSVKATMLRDWCTWDTDYNQLVQSIRDDLLALATDRPGYTAVLMQGSGTFSVESVIGTAIPAGGKLLVLANGAYGQRMAEIARYLKIPVQVIEAGETAPIDPAVVDRTLSTDSSITHVAVVHVETTTGILNPIEEIGSVTQSHRRIYIVDAMSSFGGIPLTMESVGADYLVSSANKCIQGVPGFGFVIAKTAALESTAGQARSLSLDLHDQWQAMDAGSGKWRFTSPTHVVRAFRQALNELADEGGVAARFARYQENQRQLVSGMRSLGFECLLSEVHQSPIITAFLDPRHPDYRFDPFYAALKKQGFVIYPGKVTDIDTFRIGNIGDIHAADIERLIRAVAQSMFWELKDTAAKEPGAAGIPQGSC